MKKRGESIPTRFEAEEEAIINQLKARTGLSRSELIRRAVRLLRLEAQKRGEVGFILEELSPPLPDDLTRGFEKKK